jgi:hypothetical protein
MDNKQPERPKEKKCPQCTYPMRILEHIEVCDNCKCFTHGNDLFFANTNLNAVRVKILVN